uniref:Ring finger protein 181 n=1 Tax=Myotis myotis TaxID=51298 RepID=A0A7J7U6G9_MYOMY|nr:ring finger protein 181 [Myotis myotis]
MASYFDEHDCEPSAPEREARTNILLEIARSLFISVDFEDLGLGVDWDHHLPPPAAKTAVESLPRTVMRGCRSGENTDSFCSLRQVCQTSPPIAPPTPKPDCGLAPRFSRPGWGR